MFQSLEFDFHPNNSKHRSKALYLCLNYTQQETFSRKLEINQIFVSCDDKSKLFSSPKR